MNHKRAGETKLCESLQPPENTNIFYPHGDSNIGSSEKDVPSSHEDVLSPHHVGFMMISSENEASSSSSNPQPIHLPDFLDKEAIGEDLLSQSLLDSVLKCTRLTVRGRRLSVRRRRLTVRGRKRQKGAHLLVPSEMVTSQPSHSQAGEDKEDAIFVKVKPCVCPNGPYRYIEVLNCMIPVAAEGSGELCHVCEDKHLKNRGNLMGKHHLKRSYT